MAPRHSRARAVASGPVRMPNHVARPPLRSENAILLPQIPGAPRALLLAGRLLVLLWKYYGFGAVDKEIFRTN